MVVVFQDGSYRRGLYPGRLHIHTGMLLYATTDPGMGKSRTDNVHTGMDSNVLCSCTNGDQLLDLLYDSGGDRVRFNGNFITEPPHPTSRLVEETLQL